jgi:PHP family Zn ribbon phosphoesterase
LTTSNSGNIKSIVKEVEMSFEGNPRREGKYTNAVDCPNPKCKKRFWISDIAKKTVGSVKCPHCGYTTSKK